MHINLDDPAEIQRILQGRTPAQLVAELKSAIDRTMSDLLAPLREYALNPIDGNAMESGGIKAPLFAILDLIDSYEAATRPESAVIRWSDNRGNGGGARWLN